MPTNDRILAHIRNLIIFRLPCAIAHINERVRGADAPVIKPSYFDAVDAEVCL